MANLLIVDDHQTMRQLWKMSLLSDGYTVFEAENGEQALDVIDRTTIHLIVADVMMPEMDGFELTRLLRAHNYDMPILIVTAKNTMLDKRIGFESGADDYLVKPVQIDELRLRVKALLRRARIVSEHQLTLGGMALNRDTLQVMTNQGLVDLTKKEFLLLFYLCSYPEHIFTRQALMDEIWGMESQADERTVDVHIKRLREKLSGQSGVEIITVRGLGYKVREAKGI